MELEEFLAKVKEVCYAQTEKSFRQEYGRYSRRDQNEYDDVKPYVISAEECVGGMSGGSCWGGTATGFTRPEGAIDCRRSFDESFDKLLGAICPNITYLQYKRLTNLIKNRDYSVGEYYGNSSDYLVIYILLEELYEEMKKMDLL